MDWGEIGNIGTDSEDGQFLRNNEESQGYGELQIQTDVGFYSPKGEIVRGIKGEKKRSFRQFPNKSTGSFKGRNNFRHMQTNEGNLGEERNLLRGNKLA